MNANYKTTIKNNGQVKLWDVYRQQWRTLAADAISDELMATLSAAERAAIEALRDGIRPSLARAILRQYGRDLSRSRQHGNERAWFHCVSGGGDCGAAHGGTSCWQWASSGHRRPCESNGRHVAYGEWRLA